MNQEKTKVPDNEVNDSATPLADRTSLAWMGTAVVNGHGLHRNHSDPDDFHF